MLTISKFKRWSINYYLDTAQSAHRATEDCQPAGGGLGARTTERSRIRGYDNGIELWQVMERWRAKLWREFTANVG